jgi:hypothetical protein
MPGSRLHPVTIRLPTPIWEDVEKAAKADRRAVATYIALLIQDVVAAQSAGSDSRVPDALGAGAALVRRLMRVPASGSCWLAAMVSHLYTKVQFGAGCWSAYSVGCGPVAPPPPPPQQQGSHSKAPAVLCAGAFLLVDR